MSSDVFAEGIAIDTRCDADSTMQVKVTLMIRSKPTLREPSGVQGVKGVVLIAVMLAA